MSCTWESNTKQVVAGLHWMIHRARIPHRTMGQPLDIFTWSPDDLYLVKFNSPNKDFSNQNKGHLGSRYILQHCNLTPIPPVLPCTFYFGTTPMNNLRKKTPMD